MRDLSVRIVLVYLYLFISYTSYGQDKQLPIDQWIKVLCLKHDIRFTQLYKVCAQVAGLDSTTKCLALSRLKKEGPQKNKRYTIKLDLLKRSCFDWTPVCDDPRTLEEILSEAFKLAYEIEDDYLIAMVNQYLMMDYIRQNKLGQAVMYGMIALGLQKEQGQENFGGYSSIRDHLGMTLYKSREYSLAIPVLYEAVHGYVNPSIGVSDTLDPYYRMNGWNALALCYEKLEKYDSALIAFNYALGIALHEKELFWTGLLKGNIGSVFYDLAQYDTAEVLLKMDVQQSIKSLQFDNAANSLQTIARIDAIRGNPELGLQKLNECTRLLQHVPRGVIWAHVYDAYTFIYQKLGNADSLYYYSQKLQPLHDSLERVSDNNRAEIVQLRMDNQLSVNQILSLNKEKRRIALIRNFTIGIILLLAGLAYIDFSRHKIKNQLQRREAQEKQRLAEAETFAAHEQLNEFTQGVLEKSVLIENLQKQLLDRNTTAEQHQMIVDLSHQQLLTDADWEKFKSLFERVYPGFFISLKEKVREITQAELRMAALIRLKMTTKESAAMLGVSLDSIHKTRQRLKQRLQIAPDAELDEVITTF